MAESLRGVATRWVVAELAGAYVAGRGERGSWLFISILSRGGRLCGSGFSSVSDE